MKYRVLSDELMLLGQTVSTAQWIEDPVTGQRGFLMAFISGDRFLVMVRYPGNLEELDGVCSDLLEG